MGDASYLEEISSKEAFINRVTNPTMEANWAKMMAGTSKMKKMPLFPTDL